MSQFSLFQEKRFSPLFWTQFFSSFNDNAFKNALVILVTFKLASTLAVQPAVLVNLAGGLLVLPFFLFSATAGQLADKNEKSNLIVKLKAVEVLFMLFACIALMFEHVPSALVTIFLLGTQAAFFGPLKFGILPQHLKESELVPANGLIEMGTFLAILVGTLAGGSLVLVEPYGKLILCSALFLFAIVSYRASLKIPRAEAANPDLNVSWNIFTQMIQTAKIVTARKTISLSILGVSWFWFLGATFLSLFPSYAKDVLGGNEHTVTLFLTTFSVGIAVGSLLCDRLSAGKIELGLVPFGSIGMSVFTFDLFLAGAFLPRVLADLALIGMFSGFYIVPLNALIQKRSDPALRAQVIAGNNIANALFMVLSSGFSILLIKSGFSILDIFLVVAVLNSAVAIYIYSLLPEFLIRFIVWGLVHSFYKLNARGLNNIPEKGPAILVCNHVSFVDGLIIAAACRRPPRFVVDLAFWKMPIVGWVYRQGKAIPIAPAKENPDALTQAYDRISEALAEGDLVCIFPEGRITKTGEMNEFKKGIEQIVKRNPVPVIPMAVRGLWGSFFSRYPDGQAMRRFPRKIPYSLELICDFAIAPENVRADELQKHVARLRGERR